MTITAAHSWSVADVLALQPCARYSESVLLDLWQGRDRLSITEVADLPIPEPDRLWLICRAPWPVIEPAITRIVTRAVRTHALPCDATRAWAELWLSGKDRSAEAARAEAASAEAAWAAWEAARATARATERALHLADFRALEGEEGE